jgi:hypothetical protein
MDDVRPWCRGVVARISGVGAVKRAMAIVRAGVVSYFHGTRFTATSIAEKSRMQYAAERSATKAHFSTLEAAHSVDCLFG